VGEKEEKEEEDEEWNERESSGFITQDEGMENKAKTNEADAEHIGKHQKTPKKRSLRLH